PGPDRGHGCDRGTLRDLDGVARAPGDGRWRARLGRDRRQAGRGLGQHLRSAEAREDRGREHIEWRLPEQGLEAAVEVAEPDLGTPRGCAQDLELEGERLV